MNNGRDTTAASEGFRGAHLLVAFLGGAAAGAITAFLTAPRSGAETRSKLRAMGEDQRENARHLPEAIKAATVAAQEAFLAELNTEQRPGPRPPSHRNS